MAQTDFVSVTLVTYNSGRFIKRCIESVLEQRYPLKEIVIVDNGFHRRHHRHSGAVRRSCCQIYYNEENVGFAAAQNQAIQMLSGRAIGF